MGRKTALWAFQATNKQNLTRENVDGAKKEKPYEGNWIFSSSWIKQRHKGYVKKIYKKQENTRCRLWDDRDETLNHITSEYSNFA